MTLPTSSRRTSTRAISKSGSRSTALLIVWDPLAVQVSYPCCGGPTGNCGGPWGICGGPEGVPPLSPLPPTPPLASFLGFRSRTLVVLVPFFLAILFLLCCWFTLCQFNTVCGAGLFNSSCALTFCRPAVSASICFCCLAMVAACFCSS